MKSVRHIVTAYLAVATLLLGPALMATHVECSNDCVSILGAGTGAKEIHSACGHAGCCHHAPAKSPTTHDGAGKVGEPGSVPAPHPHDGGRCSICRAWMLSRVAAPMLVDLQWSSSVPWSEPCPVYQAPSVISFRVHDAPARGPPAV